MPQPQIHQYDSEGYNAPAPPSPDLLADKELITHIKDVHRKLETLPALELKLDTLLTLTSTLQLQSAYLTDDARSRRKANRTKSMDLLMAQLEDDKQMSHCTTGHGSASSPESHMEWSDRTSDKTIPECHSRPTLRTKCTAELKEVIHKHGNRNLLSVVGFRFLEDPHSSWPAAMYATVMGICTIAGVALTFWQSVEGCPLKGESGDIIQIILETLFTIEIVVRFSVAPDTCQFWKNPYNYIDIISILPLPIRGMMLVLSPNGSDELFEKIAFVPVLRLLKLMRHFESFQLLISAFFLALEALPVLLYTMGIIALVFSALIRMVEPEDSIQNLPQALWFIVVTMATVGYGDVTPSTTMGRVVMMSLMVVSLLYMAIPIGIVGHAFSQVWEARDRLLLIRRLREAFLHHGFNPNAMKHIVGEFDLDGDGSFSLEEFQTMLRAMRIHISDDRVIGLMATLDQDDNGSIDIEELMHGLFPRDFGQLLNAMALKKPDLRATKRMSGNAPSHGDPTSSIGTANFGSSKETNLWQTKSNQTTITTHSKVSAAKDHRQNQRAVAANN